jgi:LEA14-like dessication related protein
VRLSEAGRVAILPTPSWRILVALAALSLGACAGLPRTEPLQVTVAGIEPLQEQGEGLELRLLVKLRIQNPNDAAFDFDGAYVRLEVLGKTFATGVSDQTGTVPRFGETVVNVPVTVPVLRMVRQVMGVLDGKPVERVDYVLEGKLDGTGLSSRRFQSKGELTLPGWTVSPEGVSAADVPH